MTSTSTRYFVVHTYWNGIYCGPTCVPYTVGDRRTFIWAFGMMLRLANEALYRGEEIEVFDTDQL